MKNFWEGWLDNNDLCETDFQRFLQNKKIRKNETVKETVNGRLEKAEHNLEFTSFITNSGRFNDWSFIGSYYSIYQSALALCNSIGYSTKDHSATLLILIKFFYKEGLDRDEIETLARTTFEKDEILNYVEARIKRQTASYSSSILFSKTDAEILRLEAVLFVNKVKDILRV